MASNVHFITERVNRPCPDAFLVFERLSKLSNFHFFLEGFEEWDGTSPYSYLGIDPVEILKVSGGKVSFLSAASTTREPLEAIKEFFARYKVPPPKKGELTFRGGAVGYVSYESSKFFESALRGTMKALDDTAPETCLMVFKTIIGVAHDLSHMVFSSFVLSDEEKDLVRQDVEGLKDKIFSGPYREIKSVDRSKALALDLTQLPVTSRMGEHVYMEGVKQIKKHIRQGDIFQCVLSDQFYCNSDVSPLRVYEKLRATNPSPFMFYISAGEEIILGASPERLVKVAGQIVETNPIAGTRPRGKTPADDKKNEKQLLASPKEKAEHLMLVDLGRNDIGRVAEPGSVSVGEFMVVKRFSDVMHLISKVKGRLLKKLSSWDALASCFPAGTLSGAPKIRAMQIISDLETVPRHFYGGAIVKYEFDGSLDSCIAIRSVRKFKDKYTFQAGGGIVADSDPAREYQEVMAKSRSIRRALLLAQMEDL